MFKRPTRWMATALVVGALTACSDGLTPTEPSLDSTTESLSTDLIDASLYDSDPTLASATLYTEASGAALVPTTRTDAGQVVTMVVGPGGGEIRAGDHSLAIPRNAVSKATEFRMEVVAGTNILVDLSARGVASGKTVSQFSVPLTLTLSYKGIFSGADVRRLRNVYLYRDSPSYLLPLTSVLHKKDKTLSSPISHFSLYGMAIE